MTKFEKFVTALALAMVLLLGLNHYAETQITQRARTWSGDTFVADGFGLVIGHTAHLTIGEVAEFQILGTAGPDSQVAFGRFAADASGPAARFLKSRGTTIGSNAIVNDNDTVGLIIFQPDDGADFDTAAARIAAEVDDANPLAGDIGMAFIWEQMPGDATALRETMRLDAAGDLTLATGGSVISDTIQTTTVTISNAEMTELNTTPIQVVAAPGANRVIIVDSSIFFNNNGGTDFTEENTDETLTVDYDNSGVDVITAFDTTAFITSTGDSIIEVKANALVASDPATVFVNEKLQVRVVGTGDFATGDGTMDVTVIYHILATP